MDNDELDELDELEDGTFEDRLLAHATRQTKVLESIQTILWAWSALTVILGVVLVIALLGD